MKIEHELGFSQFIISDAQGVLEMVNGTRQ